MKKPFLLLTIALFTSLIQVKASDASLFYLDERGVYDEFEGLSLLENHVFLNEGITLIEMIKKEDPLIKDINLSASSKDFLNAFDSSEFDTTSFMLGVGAGIVACGLGCLISVYVFAYNF